MRIFFKKIICHSKILKIKFQLFILVPLRYNIIKMKTNIKFQLKDIEIEIWRFILYQHFFYLSIRNYIKQK
jgi:hypothetical protein